MPQKIPGSKKLKRTTIREMSEATLSETVSLESLKFLFPWDWEKKLEELKKSKWVSVIYPE